MALCYIVAVSSIIVTAVPLSDVLASRSGSVALNGQWVIMAGNPQVWVVALPADMQVLAVQEPAPAFVKAPADFLQATCH